MGRGGYMSKQLRLSQAISAKICHDLSGAVGTIVNCLDLIYGNDVSISKKAGELVDLESKKLVARIRFLRSTYGLSDGDKDISLIFLSKLLKDFFHHSNVKLQLKFEQGMIFLSIDIAKAAMALASIISDSIGSSGTLELSINHKKEKDIEIAIKAGGKAVHIKDENVEILTGNKKPLIGVHNCREHYVRDLYSRNGYQLTVNKEESRIVCEMRRK